MALRVLDAAAVREALPMVALVDALEAAFGREDPSAGPLRTHLETDRGSLLLMPAWGAQGVGVKIVTLTPENPASGQPLIGALYVLFDALTQQPAAVLDGAELTARRTAAVSGLATRYLAGPGARRLAVVGAGVQARAHIEAMRAVRPIEEVVVIARTSAHALVEELMAEGSNARVGQPADLQEADLICTCTTSVTPVVRGADIARGVHVNAVGAFGAAARELDTDAVRAARVVVETRQAALAEAGELAIPIAEGTVGEDVVVADLHELVNGASVRGATDDRTVFLSVGIAFEDLVVASAILAVGRDSGVGSVARRGREVGRVGGSVRHPRLGRSGMGGIVLATALIASACDPRGGGDIVSASPSPPDRFGTIEIAPGEPIQLGALLATTGDAAGMGTDALRGVQLAVDYLDGTFDGTAGTLLGHPIALVSRDEGCTAAGGRDGARNLAEDPQLVGVIGPTCSVSALGGAATLLSERGVVMISPSATDPALTEVATHEPFFLRVGYDDRLQGAVAADFSYRELGSRTAATTYPDEAFASASSTGFRDRFERAGGRVTASVAVPSAPRDAARLLSAIGSARPDVLYTWDRGSACADVLGLVRGTPGLGSTAFVGGGGCFSTAFLQAARPGSDPVYVAGPDLTTMGGDFYRLEFLPAYASRYGSAPISADHAFAFDAATMLFDALEVTGKKASDGTITISRTALREALFATDGYQGLSGSLSCTPLGDCTTSVAVAVYEVPAVPLEGGDPEAKPVFSETLSIDDLPP